MCTGLQLSVASRVLNITLFSSVHLLLYSRHAYSCTVRTCSLSLYGFMININFMLHGERLSRCVRRYAITAVPTEVIKYS